MNKDSDECAYGFGVLILTFAACFILWLIIQGQNELFQKTKELQSQIDSMQRSIKTLSERPAI